MKEESSGRGTCVGTVNRGGRGVSLECFCVALGKDVSQVFGP